MTFYRVAEDKEHIEVGDLNISCHTLKIRLVKWKAFIDLPVVMEEDRIYFTDELVFIHKRNGDNFKVFRSLLSAIQSTKTAPGYTYSIEVRRLQ